MYFIFAMGRRLGTSIYFQPANVYGQIAAITRYEMIHIQISHLEYSSGLLDRKKQSVRLMLGHDNDVLKNGV